MKTTEIYQTLEDRQNYEEVEQHGPYFCSVTYPNGIRKKGSKQPWLGSGYYFGILEFVMLIGGGIMFITGMVISFVTLHTTSIRLCYMIW